VDGFGSDARGKPVPDRVFDDRLQDQNRDERVALPRLRRRRGTSSRSPKRARWMST
jgi:hypothetical protein